MSPKIMFSRLNWDHYYSHQQQTITIFRIELQKLFVSTINELLAINACITVGGTKEHCQTTTEFSKEAEDLQGIFKKSVEI